MKSVLMASLVVLLMSPMATAACRWCTRCNTWHCDGGSQVMSQPVGQAWQSNRPVYSNGYVQNTRPIQQTSYSQPARYGGGGGYAQEVLRLTNEYRARNGRPPLTLSQSMGAQQHAQSMASSGRMYHGRGVTENVAFGSMSPQQVVNMWINSPGHRRNILGNHSTLDVGNSGRGWVQRFR